jgi:hypothetical protein
MKPAGPCFVVGPKGYFSLSLNYSSQQTGTLLGLLRGFFGKMIVYDANGRLWSAKGVEIPFKRTWWRVLLANTVYNPLVTVNIIWQNPKNYALEDLTKAYLKAVQRDDDILTQFVEADALKNRIAAAKCFSDLVDVYTWAQTGSDSEQTTS